MLPHDNRNVFKLISLQPDFPDNLKDRAALALAVQLFILRIVIQQLQFYITTLFSPGFLVTGFEEAAVKWFRKQPGRYFKKVVVELYNIVATAVIALQVYPGSGIQFC